MIHVFKLPHGELKYLIALGLLLTANAMGASDGIPAGASLLQRKPEPELSQYTDIRYSPDGKVIITGHFNGEICLWSAATCQYQRVLGRIQGYVNAVAVAPNGLYMAAGGEDPMTHVWNVAKNEVCGRLPCHKGHLTCLTFSPDSKLLITGGTDATVSVWRIDGRKRLFSLRGHEQRIYSVAYDSTRDLVLSAGLDKTVCAWDVKTGRLHCRRVNMGFPLAVAPNGEIAAYPRPVAGGAQYSIVIVAPKTLEEICQIPHRGDTIEEIAFSQDNRLMAVSGSGGDTNIHIYELATKKELIKATYPLSGNLTTSVAFSPGGVHFVSAHSDDYALRWSLLEAAMPPHDRRDTAGMLWRELGNEAPGPAYGAISLLCSKPKSTLSYFSEVLLPSSPISDQQLDRVVKELDSESFDIRENASRRLLAMGTGIALRLKKHLPDPSTSPEQRRRIQRALDSLSRQRLQQSRAIATLEYLSGPVARSLLQRLASGEPHAPLTVEASQALKRLRQLERR